MKYGILEAGIGLKGKERTVKLLGPTGWYEKDDIPGLPPLSAAPR